MVIRTIQTREAGLHSAYSVPDLPRSIELENKKVMKKTAAARSALAELKGVTSSVPNESIFVSTLALQEAKDSSAIENIITTQDEIFQSNALTQQFKSMAAKEVHMYAAALREGYQEIKHTGLFTNKQIKAIQARLEGNEAGFRTQVGTALKNQQTGEIIYTPPQEIAQIEAHMRNLEQFINEESLCEWDSLVKMAVIHHQFESIHPFFDGNGRTGRIINILYLVKEGLLDTPILYLSRYINQNKPEYYRLLQAVRDKGVWEEWVLFMLEGICRTSYQTMDLIQKIKLLMGKYKHKMRAERPRIYSQDLLNNMFSHPYTKIEFVEAELQVSRKTAAKYLDEIVTIGLLEKHKVGKDNYYLNREMYNLFANIGTERLEVDGEALYR